MSKAARKTLGIAISGGGHRATVFALGALLYLADSGRNRDVRAIASVSGGSLANAYLALLEKPFTELNAEEFENRAARLAALVAGSPRWWARTWALYAMVCAATCAAIAVSAPWWVATGVYLFACVPLVTFVGPRSGGALWAWWGTWVYVFVLVLLTGVVVIAWSSPHRWLSGPSLLLLWAIALGQRGLVVDLAFERTICRLARPPSRDARGPACLEEMHNEVCHVVCATEMHAGTHVYFSHNFVYAEGFGIGQPGRLPLSTAVQISANFPGGFPVRFLSAARHAFRLGGPHAGWWMVLSDGGVFDNLADSWHMESTDRSNRLSETLEGREAEALKPHFERRAPVTERLVAFDAFDESEEKKRLERQDEELDKEYWRARALWAAEHRSVRECIEAWRQTPDCLIVLNASAPLYWQPMRRTWIPLLGELLGFIKVANTMYNNGNRARLRDLAVRFDKNAPPGTLVAINEDWKSQSRRLYAGSGFAYMAAQAGYLSAEKRRRVDRIVAVSDYFGLRSHEPDEDFGRLYELPAEIVATPTTFQPLGVERTAQLLYHGYLQTMLKMHIDLEDAPLLHPVPTLEDFLAVAEGRPRKSRPS